MNYKDNTYKEGGTFDSVEKVLAATAFCNYEKENGALKEVRAATGTKNKQEYYVELLKFDFGTAAVFYTKEPWKTNTPNETDPAALKYIEVYLPGETAARASFEVKVTPIQGSFVETAHSAVTELHKPINPPCLVSRGNHPQPTFIDIGIIAFLCDFNKTILNNSCTFFEFFVKPQYLCGFPVLFFFTFFSVFLYFYSY